MLTRNIANWKHCYLMKNHKLVTGVEHMKKQSTALDAFINFIEL